MIHITLGFLALAVLMAMLAVVMPLSRFRELVQILSMVFAALFLIFFTLAQGAWFSDKRSR